MVYNIRYSVIYTVASWTPASNIMGVIELNDQIYIGLVFTGWRETISVGRRPDATPRAYVVINQYYISHKVFILSQSKITCSKLTIETLEQGVKYFQSWQ